MSGVIGTHGGNDGEWNKLLRCKINMYVAQISVIQKVYLYTC